jgi:hypothetical protein
VTYPEHPELPQIARSPLPWSLVRPSG